MPAERSTQLARVAERLGRDLALTDVRNRRAGRARRVQDAWLRGLLGMPAGTRAPERREQPPR